MSGPSRVLLDTSAYSRFRAGHGGAIERMAQAESISLSAISLGELEAGFRLGSRTRENQVALTEFLAEPFVTLLPVTPDVALRYGELFAALKRAGTPIPVNDIWIAATAADAGAHVLTFDTDFGRIPGLSWTLLA